MRQRAQSFPPFKKEPQRIKPIHNINESTEAPPAPAPPAPAPPPPPLFSVGFSLVSFLGILIICGLPLVPKLLKIATSYDHHPFLSSSKMNDKNDNIQESKSLPRPPQFDSLTIVSMNLAGCVPSAEAPPSWDATYVEQVVRQELLQKDPDILALQECPGKEAWAEKLFEGYKTMGGVGYAHAGYVLLLVRDSLSPSASPVSLPRNLPAVMVQIVLVPDPTKHEKEQLEGSTNSRTILNVASCHLAPSAGGAQQRSKQIRELLKVSGDSSPLVIAGDTNMRWEEDGDMEGPLYKLRDAWKEAGEDPAKMYTWDTENHIDQGGFFNRYYGENTREYTTRYDRIYISDKSRRVSVASFGLVANQPVTPFSKTHFLSDHFGITCRLKLN